MKFVENPELKKEVAKLQAFLKQIHDDMSCLNEAVTDHETDDMHAIQTYDDNVFDLTQRLFTAKVNLGKLHKKIHAHISEVLAPDYYMKKTLARKKKGVVDKPLHPRLREDNKHITIKRNKDNDGNTQI